VYTHSGNSIFEKLLCTKLNLKLILSLKKFQKQGNYLEAGNPTLKKKHIPLHVSDYKSGLIQKISRLVCSKEYACMCTPTFQIQIATNVIFLRRSAEILLYTLF